VSEAAFLYSAFLTVLLACCAIEWVLWQTGATLTPAAAAAMQAGDPKVVWAGLANQYADFKIHRIAQEKPDIVIIGDSPCSQLRSAMFKPYKTYNFCTTAWTIDQISDIVVRVDNAVHPKLIIFSLGYYFFLDAWVTGWANKIPMVYDVSWSEAHADGLLRLIQLFQAHPGAFVQFLAGSTHETIDGMGLSGADSVALGFGIRYDGSVLYPSQMRAAAPEHNQNPFFGFLEAIPGSPQLQPAQLQAVERLGAIGKERGLTLVGIQFPILKATVDFLDHDPFYRDYAGAWRQFESASTRLRFRDFGIKLFDASHDAVTADRDNFLDPLHPTERGMLGVLIHLLDDPEFHSMLPDIDEAALRRKYQEANSAGETFDVYHAEF